MEVNSIYNGDCLEFLRGLPDGVVNTCVTSPPYFGLRDYGHSGQIGLEETPDMFVQKLVEVFREVRRVLRDDGTLWLNLGDSYVGSGNLNPHGGARKDRDQSAMGFDRSHISYGEIRPKNLIGIPWMVAFALRADGWYLRQDIIWHKPNPMPESVTDRCTKSHEYIFLLSKSPRYYFDNEAIKEDSVYFGKDNRSGEGNIRYEGKRTENNTSLGQQSFVTINEKKNKRSVWTVTTKPFKDSHFATFPVDLIVPCILAGCPADGIVLDPFMGAGTTAVVAKKLGRNYVGSELNSENIEIINKRLRNEFGIFA